MRKRDDATPPARRQGPGRPEGVSQAREHILNAAEEAFAALGYAGTSLREIVERAHVTKSLVNYHFGSKEKLFEEVFLRRGQPIAAERMARLARLRARPGGFTAEDLVHGFLTPSLKMPRTAGARRFLRIQARLHMEPEEFAYALRRKVYEESTKAYAAAFCEVMPELTPQKVYWRLILIIGANLYAVSDTHRIAELSGGLCDPSDLDELFENVTEFVCGGIAAKSFAARRDGRRRSA